MQPAPLFQKVGDCARRRFGSGHNDLKIRTGIVSLGKVSSEYEIIAALSLPHSLTWGRHSSARKNALRQEQNSCLKAFTAVLAKRATPTWMGYLVAISWPTGHYAPGLRTSFLFENSSNPNRDSSRPKPESFTPPNGRSGADLEVELIQTMPTSNLAATSSAASKSVE